MKRSPIQRKTPLKRISWKSSPTDPKDWRTQLRSGGIKTRVKKPTVAEGSKYLAACRGEPCYLRIPGVCRLRDPEETIVPAHRNEGKGTGLKVSNELTCPACHACHMEFDQGKRFIREEKREMWNRAYAEWQPVRDRKMNLQPELEAA
ncbi:nuclease domain-containing protein [Paraburkholderia sediminicola]|uniref:nuclease domain-containing protein n=1 Tax=Paraburkholderia sediminicola TaxID=458836 RepID=UPI0038BD8348